MALTPRQRKFAEAYAGNGTEAARLAGYKGNDQVLATQAGRLLRNAEVAAEIKARENKTVRQLIASREDRQAFWSKVMRAEELDMSARLKASELLGRSEADFTEKLQHSGTVRVAFSISRAAKK